MEVTINKQTANEAGKKVQIKQAETESLQNATELSFVARLLWGSVANVPIETLLEKTNLSLVSV